HMAAAAADAKMIEQELRPDVVATRELWPGGMPVHLSEAWEALKSALLAADENWDVWIDWYEERLSGRETDETLELARATIPDEFWEQGPQVLNGHIKRL